jgi:hypothetical protein
MAEMEFIRSSLDAVTGQKTFPVHFIVELTRTSLKRLSTHQLDDRSRNVLGFARIVPIARVISSFTIFD